MTTLKKQVSDRCVMSLEDATRYILKNTEGWKKHLSTIEKFLEKNGCDDMRSSLKMVIKPVTDDQYTATAKFSIELHDDITLNLFSYLRKRGWEYVENELELAGELSLMEGDTR